MKKDDQINKELTQQQAKDAAKRLFGKRTKEQNKALRNIKTIGSPDNITKQDSETEDSSSNETN
ncbi:MAG: hypothetical protein V4732_05000 [Pseudomonadota bacterium]